MLSRFVSFHLLLPTSHLRIALNLESRFDRRVWAWGVNVTISVCLCEFLLVGCDPEITYLTVGNAVTETFDLIESRPIRSSNMVMKSVFGAVMVVIPSHSLTRGSTISSQPSLSCLLSLRLAEVKKRIYEEWLIITT